MIDVYMVMKQIKVIFLDRDGTINEEVEYLHRIEDFVFIDKAQEALKIFKRLGYELIVVTNQSGVARGYFDEETIINLHNYMDTVLNEKSDTKLIRRYYYCPHHELGSVDKYAINCTCRKPLSGMLDKAIADLGLQGYKVSLEESFIVGDKESDIEAGINGGVKNKVLLRSGHEINEATTLADYIYNDIYCFATQLKEESKVKR